MQCEFPSCGQKVVVVSEQSSTGISTVLVPGSVGLGWVSLPWISLLGLACMDTACQVSAQNHFRLSPRMLLQSAAKCQHVLEQTSACRGSAEEQQLLCKGEGNGLWKFCTPSMGLGLHSDCLEVVVICFILLRGCPYLCYPPAHFTNTPCRDVPREFKSWLWDQGTTQGSRGNPWPLLAFRCNFSGEELCKSWETPCLQALVGFSAFFSDCGFSSITICISGKAEAWQAQGFVVVVFVFFISQCCSTAWHKKTLAF